MKVDPIEETEQFKAIEKEVERKVMQYYVEEKLKVLEDIVDNGCTYEKMNRVFVWYFPLGEETPSPERALEGEKMALKELEEMRKALESETLEYVYDHYVLKLFGFCHGYWNCKKKILKDDYGIDWKTPDEMNPEICFD